MMRVCARRAVGIAVGRWLEWFPREGWRGDALHQLRQIHQDESFPLEIRQAAERLTTKITERKSAAFSTNPISDAQVIIKYLSARQNL